MRGIAVIRSVHRVRIIVLSGLGRYWIVSYRLSMGQPRWAIQVISSVREQSTNRHLFKSGEGDFGAFPKIEYPISTPQLGEPSVSAILTDYDILFPYTSQRVSKF